MKIWFIRHNNESLGPYTVEELQNLSVTKDDYVWREGLTDWSQAKNITELKPIFDQPSPPPFAQQTTPLLANASHDKFQNIEDRFEKTGRTIGKAMCWTGIAVLVLTAILFINYRMNSAPYISPFSTSVPKSAEELRADLAQTEKQNPAHYITGSTSNHQNLVNQTVLEGSLTNSATIAVFKDVLLQLDFLSKTNSIITSQNITVYEVLAPKQTVYFKRKIFISKEVGNVSVTILGATPAN